MIKTSGKTLIEALAHSPLAALLERVRQSEQAAAALRDRCGELDLPADFFCEIRDDVLLIVAGNSAQAAKLRQKLPEFQRLLVSRQTKITAIRVALQPGRSIYPVGAIGADPTLPTGERPALDAEAALEFARKLEANRPESPLGRAAGRLAAALKRRNGC
jgi:hypothetical protein